MLGSFTFKVFHACIMTSKNKNINEVRGSMREYGLKKERAHGILLQKGMINDQW